MAADQVAPRMQPTPRSTGDPALRGAGAEARRDRPVEPDHAGLRGQTVVEIHGGSLPADAAARGRFAAISGCGRNTTFLSLPDHNW